MTAARPFLALVALLTALSLAACPKTETGTGIPSPQPTSPLASRPPVSPLPSPTPSPRASEDPRRGIANGSPWLAHAGTAKEMGDLAKVASTYRLIVVEADPDRAYFTKAQIATLRAGGANRVLSSLKLGSVESFRSYWTTGRAPYVAANSDINRQLGPVKGAAGEVWMDPSNANWQGLWAMVVAKRLVDQGVDGFLLERVDLVDHLPDAADAPCDGRCRQGVLAMINLLRATYPDKLIVVADATSDVVRLGSTATTRTSDALDGIMRRAVTHPTVNEQARQELLAWKAMRLQPGGHPFWLGTLEQLAGCSDTAAARAAFEAGRRDGFSPSAVGGTAGVPCFWEF